MERVVNKRGQLTIFIIIAIAVIVIGFLIYMFYPSIRSALGVGPKTPDGFIQTCLEEDIEKAIEVLSLQGGS